jgi:hypothetical protein
LHFNSTRPAQSKTIQAYSTSVHYGYLGIICLNKHFWPPGFDVVHKLPLPAPLVPPVPPGLGVVVGGASSKELDLTIQRPHPLPVLNYEHLAVMQMSYVTTRADTNKQVYEIVKIPRLRKGHTALSQLKEFGVVLENVTKGNDDLPPIATGQDFHGSHLYIVMAHLGILPWQFRGQANFFRDCKYKSMQHIPLFIYQAMYWKTHFCANSGCGAHLHKAWIEATRSGIRIMLMFDFWTSTISGVAGGRGCKTNAEQLFGQVVACKGEMVL